MLPKLPYTRRIRHGNGISCAEGPKKLVCAHRCTAIELFESSSLSNMSECAYDTAIVEWNRLFRQRMLIAPQYSWCADFDEGEDEDDSEYQESESDQDVPPSGSTADQERDCEGRVSRLLEHAQTLAGGDQKAQVARDLAVVCKQTGRAPSPLNQLARASDPGKNQLARAYQKKEVSKRTVRRNGKSFANVLNWSRHKKAGGRLYPLTTGTLISTAGEWVMAFLADETKSAAVRAVANFQRNYNAVQIGKIKRAHGDAQVASGLLIKNPASRLGAAATRTGAIALMAAAERGDANVEALVLGLPAFKQALTELLAVNEPAAGSGGQPQRPFTKFDVTYVFQAVVDYLTSQNGISFSNCLFAKGKELGLFTDKVVIIDQLERQVCSPTRPSVS